MRKTYIIISIIILLASAAYLYIRFGILKSKNFKPDTSKSTSLIDLRPALIARLQQLVKDGSHGLYNLSIDKLEPHISDLSVDITNAVLTPDSAVLAKLDSSKKAPDNVLRISCSALHIDGIGVHDLLSTDQIDVKTLHFANPVVDIYHFKKKYSKQKEEKPDSVTLYRLLMKSIKKIQIGAVSIDNGTFINHNLNEKNNITHIDRIAMDMKDILVDSSTQYDTERFLFAKTADISLTNYLLRTADSLYFFKASSIKLSAVKHNFTALNVELVPRVSRKQFEKNLRYRNDMFTIKTGKIVLGQVNLFDFVNNEKLILNEGTIENCDFYDFFDTSVPASTSPSPLNNFPHQQLLRVHLPIYIRTINLKHVNIRYEEFNPATNKSGTVYFNDVNGQATNVTNMPAYILKNNKIKFSATALFMKKVNLQIAFLFDLKNIKNGHFTAGLTLGKIDSTLLNPVCEPLGLVSIKKGTINKMIAHIDANNYKGAGKLLLLYNDLHLDPLKRDDEGKLKKKGIVSFLANFLLVKNSNPSGRKAPRTAESNYTRDPRGSSFYNFIFKIILTGVLKAIGLPEKIAYK